MQKTFARIFILFIFLVSCGGDKIIESLHFEYVEEESLEIPQVPEASSPALAEEESSPFESLAPIDDYAVINNGKNFRVLQLYNSQPGYFRYEIVSNSGEVVYHADTRDNAWFERFNEDILQFTIMRTEWFG